MITNTLVPVSRICVFKMADEGESNVDNADCTINEGKHVILRLNKNLKVVPVQRDRKIFLEKLRFVINEAIGCPFGSVFEVRGDNLCKVSPDEDVDELRSTENGDKGAVYQAIKSEGVTQKLSREDVVSLKAQGATGKDIVDQLVENSTTFKDRTEFSKAKYRSKKTKKHSAKISILKPSTSLLSEMYYNSKVSHKICELRPDALSQILTLANIRATSKILVMEQCQGLVTGAVLERMSGYGSIVQIHNGDFPIRIAMDYFNFTPEVLETVHGFPLSKLYNIDEPDPELKEEEMELPKEAVMDSKGNEKKQEETYSEEKDKKERREGPMKEEEKIARRNKRKKEELAAKNILQNKRLDGLVVVCKFHPSTIMPLLLEYVAPSRPFVVYSQYKEPLVECYSDLRSRGGVVNLQLTETWWRHYQVLPGRTHPLVTMDGSGGYLLSGTTVERPLKTPSTPEKHKTSETIEDTTLEPPAKKFKDDV